MFCLNHGLCACFVFLFRSVLFCFVLVCLFVCFCFSAFSVSFSAFAFQFPLCFAFIACFLFFSLFIWFSSVPFPSPLYLCFFFFKSCFVCYFGALCFCMFLGFPCFAAARCLLILPGVTPIPLESQKSFYHGFCVHLLPHSIQPQEGQAPIEDPHIYIYIISTDKD